MIASQRGVWQLGAADEPAIALELHRSTPDFAAAARGKNLYFVRQNHH